jgi:simple sugar transport system ATP-binding protein
LRDYREPGFQRGGLLDETGLEALAEERRRRFQIRAPGLGEATGRLSGGNIQRVILARELGRSCDLLVAHNPTSGLDIAGIEFVLDKIRAAAREGAAVVLISDDIDEILDLADRVLVLARGHCGLLKRTDNWDRAAMGRLMLGGSANAVVSH